jgi:hypothetical protein
MAIDVCSVFEKIEEEEYGKFDRVENPPSTCADLCAFILLDKLVPGKRDIVTHAEHDQIWVGVSCDELKEVATEEDILYLVRCGVFLNDYEYLSLYV